MSISRIRRRLRQRPRPAGFRRRRISGAPGRHQRVRFMSTGARHRDRSPAERNRTARDPYEATMKSRSITGRDPSTGNVLEVIVENGRIRAIIPSPIEEAPWLSPGFIDLAGEWIPRQRRQCRRRRSRCHPRFDEKNARAGSHDISSHPHHRLRRKNHSRAASHCGSQDKPIRRSPMQFPLCTWKVLFISANDGPRGAHDREHVRPGKSRGVRTLAVGMQMVLLAW